MRALLFLAVLAACGREDAAPPASDGTLEVAIKDDHYGLPAR